MTTYRAYHVDGRRRIIDGRWLEASDDAEAKDQAEELCEEGAPTIELWQAARLVGEIDCDDDGTCDECADKDPDAAARLGVPASNSEKRPDTSKT